jgi:flagellar biosynthetic protein FliR
MLELGQFVLSWMESLILPFTRVTAFFLAAPLFTQIAGSVRIRLIYALVLCVLMLPAMPTSLTPPQVPFGEPNLLTLLSEALIGVSIGLVLQFITSAVVMAGEQISMSVGIGFAQSFDPSMGSTPVLSQFLNLIGLLVFITADGHTVIISMMTESIRVLPPGSFSLLDVQAWIEFSSVIFRGAALLCAPLLLALLAVNIGVGALSRATPSLNVFAVGFAVSLLTGFALLYVLMPIIGERMIELWQLAERYIRARLLGVG